MRDGGPRFRSSSEAFDTCTNQRRDELNMVDSPLITRSKARSGTSAGSSMTLDASLTVIRPCSTARRTTGAAGPSSASTLAAWATVLLLTRSSAATSPWVKELCKFAPFSFRGRRGADDAESLWGSAQ